MDDISPVFKALSENKILRNFVYVPEADSTNSLLMKSPQLNGTVALAEKQTAGRGKQGAAWNSPGGGLWFSFILRKKIKKPYPMVALVSVAITDVLIKNGIKAEIKWPNDILIGGKKACGILIENDYTGSKLVTGIGLNVNNDIPAELKDKAVSVSAAIGQKADRISLLIALVRRIDYYLSLGNPAKKSIAAAWVKRMEPIEGKVIKLEEKGRLKSYTVVKTLKNGSIRVRSEKGKIKVISGETFFL